MSRHHPRRRQHPHQGDQRHDGSQGPGHPIHQQLGGRHAAFAAILAQHRHERLVEGPFGKQTAEKIGDFQGHEKGIGPGGGPQHTGNHHVPNQPQHPRQHGHGCHHGSGGH